MFAYIRNTQAGYQSLGFPQGTLTFDRVRCRREIRLARLTEFFDVAVESSGEKR
jgi:hypothetical protein